MNKFWTLLTLVSLFGACLLAGGCSGGDESENAPTMKEIDKGLEGVPAAPEEVQKMPSPKKGTLK